MKYKIKSAHQKMRGYMRLIDLTDPVTQNLVKGMSLLLSKYPESRVRLHDSKLTINLEHIHYLSFRDEESDQLENWGWEYRYRVNEFGIVDTWWMFSTVTDDGD